MALPAAWRCTPRAQCLCQKVPPTVHRLQLPERTARPMRPAWRGFSTGQAPPCASLTAWMLIRQGSMHAHESNRGLQTTNAHNSCASPSLQRPTCQCGDRVPVVEVPEHDVQVHAPVDALQGWHLQRAGVQEAYVMVACGSVACIRQVGVHAPNHGLVSPGGCAVEAPSKRVISG